MKREDEFGRWDGSSYIEWCSENHVSVEVNLVKDENDNARDDSFVKAVTKMLSGDAARIADRTVYYTYLMVYDDALDVMGSKHLPGKLLSVGE